MPEKTARRSSLAAISIGVGATKAGTWLGGVVRWQVMWLVRKSDVGGGCGGLGRVRDGVLHVRWSRKVIEVRVLEI